MADDRIHLQVMTAGGVKYDKQARYVGIPLSGGSIGVLANHAPLMAAVEDGAVKCEYGDGQTEYVYVGTGVASVKDNEVCLLVRAAECAENIDLARAQAAAKRAEERIQSHAAEVDMLRAEASLHRALAREKTYGLFRNE